MRLTARLVATAPTLLVVARQLLADDPPKAWSTVQRLAGLGYDWHNIMHMIAALVTEDVHAALTERRRHDPR